MTGYLHRLYAESLAEYGAPLELTNAGGWSSETRTAFFYGKILNLRIYQELVRATQSEDKDYFPA